MKKAIKFSIWIFVGFFVCYLIGQNIVLPLRMKNQMEEVMNNSQEGIAGVKNDEDGFVVVNHLQEMHFEGKKDVDDNPWGFTIGEIDVDNVGRCLLMTPGTKMFCVVSDVSDESLQLKWMIHPWVREDSDGLEVVVTVMDTDDSSKKIEKKFEIQKSEDFLNEVLDISMFEGGKVDVEIECFNGANNDSTADWLVIQM